MRRRIRRRGRIGFARRASSARNAASATRAPPPKPSVCGEPSRVLAPRRSRRPRGHRGRDETAEDVDALAQAEPGRARRATARPSAAPRPIGTLTKKIQCQSMRLGQRSAGQQADRAARDADEGVEAHRLHALAASGNSVTMIARMTAEDKAPPRPCTKRAAMSIAWPGEAAQRRRGREDGEADEEAPGGGRRGRRGGRREQEAAEGDQVGVETQVSEDCEKRRSVWIAGRTTFTIVASSTIMSCAKRTAPSAAQRRRSPWSEERSSQT